MWPHVNSVTTIYTTIRQNLHFFHLLTAWLASVGGSQFETEKWGSLNQILHWLKLQLCSIPQEFRKKRIWAFLHKCFQANTWGHADYPVLYNSLPKDSSKLHFALSSEDHREVHVVSKATGFCHSFWWYPAAGLTGKLKAPGALYLCCWRTVSVHTVNAVGMKRTQKFGHLPEPKMGGKGHIYKPYILQV